MKGTTPPFENPDDIRVAAERSVEQVRSAFSILVQGAQKAVVAFDERMRAGKVAEQQDDKGAHEDGAREDGQQAGTTATGSAERDLSSMFEVAQKLAEAGDIQDLVRMQTTFVQAWMQILGEQARALAPAAGAIVEAVRADIGNYPPELDFAKAKEEASFAAPASPGNGFATERDIGLELDTIAALLDLANATVDEARASAASTIKDLVSK